MHASTHACTHAYMHKYKNTQHIHTCIQTYSPTDRHAHKQTDIQTARCSTPKLALTANKCVTSTLSLPRYSSTPTAALSCPPSRAPISHPSLSLRRALALMSLNGTMANEEPPSPPCPPPPPAPWPLSRTSSGADRIARRTSRFAQTKPRTDTPHASKDASSCSGLAPLSPWTPPSPPAPSLPSSDQLALEPGVKPTLRVQRKNQ